MHKKRAFTLAETLITLVIIGIIAAMTVPTLISKYQRLQFEVGFKKAYSEVNQISRMIKNDYSDDLYELFATKINNEPALAQLFKSYIKIEKKETGIRAAGGLYDKNWNLITYKNYNNTASVKGGLLDDGNAVITDGRTIMFEGGLIYNENLTWPFMVSYDVNGKNRGPNRYGYDLFSFILSRDGNFYPAGSPQVNITGLSFDHCKEAYIKDLDKSCSATDTTGCNGIGCAQKALTDPNYFKNLKF